MKVERVAAVRRTLALMMMKHNDYVGARNKLIDARAAYPGLEYTNEMIKVCDIVCAAESQGSGIDWCSILEIEETANESEIEFKYKKLIGTLESIKKKFPHIQSALGLAEKAYSLFTDREDASLSPCGSVELLDVAHSETVSVVSGDTSQSLICNSKELPLKKRLRSTDADDCEVIAETGSLNIGNVSGQEVISETVTVINKQPSLKFYSSKDRKADLFAVGQFLSVYDQEKMPRLYAQIIGIESCQKNAIAEKILFLKWLRPAPINSDEKKWHEAGLPVSCGFFKLDDDNKINKCDTIVFSHLVSSFREYHYSKELFELYPREGEVWALYREWKPFEWCSDPKTRKGCKFLLVEILTNYSTATGVKVALLVKVAGYSTIFRRTGLSYQIPASKLFGFSHNIPLRSADDMKGLFSGTVLDLDPLSIPEDVSVDTVAA